MVLTALVAAALVSATVSGTIGMAGGALLQVLMLLIGVDPLITIPIHAAVQFVSNFTRTVAHFPHVRWAPFVVLAVVALPCPMLGLWLLGGIEPNTLRGLMGAVILYGVWAPKWGVARLSDAVAFGIAGFLAGTFGVIVGAVGPILAPFIIRGTFKKEDVISTQAVCTGYLHLLKIAAFSGLYPTLLANESEAFGFADHWQLIVPMALATVIGTYIGKWLLSRVSQELFIRLFKAVLTVLAIQLVVQSVFDL